MHWLTKAAEGGDPEAQFMLGAYNYEKDEVAALRWYLRSAKQGHSTAQHRVGRCYHLGSAVANNRSAGRRWLRRAAINGKFKPQIQVC